MPFPAPPPWQASLQPALIRRLTRPLGRSGLINSQMGQTILRRATRLNQRLPLLDHQMQRWSKVVDLEAPPLPIVYVQPRSPAELSGPAMAPASAVSPQPSLLYPPKPAGERQEASSVEDLELRSPPSPIGPANVGPGPMAPPPLPPRPLEASPGDQTWPSNPSQSAATSAMVPPPAPDLLTPTPPPGLTAVQSHGGLPAPDDGNPMPGFNPLGVAAPALSPLTLGNLPTPGVIQRRSEVSAEANGWPSSAITTLPTVALPSPGLISDQPGSADPALSPTSIPSPKPLALSLPWPAETFSSSPLATPDLPNGANEAPGITPLGIAPLPLATLPAPGVIQRRSEVSAAVNGGAAEAIATLPTVAPSPSGLISNQPGSSVPALSPTSIPSPEPLALSLPWPAETFSPSLLTTLDLPNGANEAPGVAPLGIASLPLATLSAPGVIQRRSEEPAGAHGWPSSAIAALPTVAPPTPEALASSQAGIPSLATLSLPLVSPVPGPVAAISSSPLATPDLPKGANEAPGIRPLGGVPLPLTTLPTPGVIQRRSEEPAGAHGWASSAIAALPTVAPPTPEALASSQAGIPSLVTLSLSLVSPVPWPAEAISPAPATPPRTADGGNGAPGVTALKGDPLPPLPLGNLPSLGVIQRRLDTPTAPGVSTPIPFSATLVVGSSPLTEARPGIPESLPWGGVPLALPVSSFDVDNLSSHQLPEGSEIQSTPPLERARTEQRRSLPLGFGPGPKPLAKPKQRLLPNQPPKIAFRKARSTPPLLEGTASHQSGDLPPLRSQPLSPGGNDPAPPLPAPLVTSSQSGKEDWKTIGRINSSPIPPVNGITFTPSLEDSPLPLGLVPTLISPGPEARANGQPTVMGDQPATAVFASLPPLTPAPGRERHDRSPGVSGAARPLKAFALPPSPRQRVPQPLTGPPGLINLSTARSITDSSVIEGISPAQPPRTEVEVPWSMPPLPTLPLPLVSLVQGRPGQRQPDPSTRQVEEPTSPATVRTAAPALATPATAGGSGALEAQTDWGTPASSQPIAAHLNMEALLETVERRLIKRLIVESERRGKSKWP
jgi:hypothetical protein